MIELVVFILILCTISSMIAHARSDRESKAIVARQAQAHHRFMADVARNRARSEQLRQAALQYHFVPLPPISASSVAQELGRATRRAPASVAPGPSTSRH